MIWILTIDLLLTLCLGAAIAVAILLHRRLHALSRDQSELGVLTAAFQQATERAEASVGALRLSSDGLQDHLKRAQALADDLTFLIERGTAVADRLEGDVRAARSSESVAAPSQPSRPSRRPGEPASAPPRRTGRDAHAPAPGAAVAATAARAPESQQWSAAERDLLEALRRHG